MSDRCYLQPQLVAFACGLALVVPQHVAFVDGSQQFACFAAEQHDESGAACVPLTAVAPAGTAWMSVVPYSLAIEVFLSRSTHDLYRLRYK
ncbi:MAG TPA: hypothetical protein VFV93_16065 [Thermomicrobiales bacterium]|nr:hypothetical protein [Thermomicrobiales bacterium]